MKILLIAPAYQGKAFWDFQGLRALVGTKSLGLPLALPTLAALTPSQHEVIIVDEQFTAIDFNQKVDVVGISFCTHLATRAYQIADEFKRKNVAVVLGGVHASSFPEEALAHANSVLIGEAENLWEKALNDLEQGQLQRTYRQEGPVALLQRPVPRWDLVDPNNYYCFNVQIGRGCPHHCEFCIVRCFFGKEYRHKTIDNIISEIAFLKGLDARKPIFFCDDNILSHVEFSKDLFRALVPLRIQWWCQASLDRLNDQATLNLMYQAGCRMVIVGFESTSYESLCLMGKEKVNIVQEYQKTIAMIHKSGIGIIGFFLIGTDSDDKSSVKRIEQFVEENHIAFAMLNILMPFPQTVFREKMQQEGRLLDVDWSCYTMEHVALQFKHFTKEEILAARKGFLENIYSEKRFYQRLCHVWQQGAFISAKKKNWTLGHLVFALMICIRLLPDMKKIVFALKCLSYSQAPSLMSVAMAINFYNYTEQNFS